MPGPPLNVEPLDWDKNFVDLKWEPPASTGGAPVLKYIVERKVGNIFLYLSEVRLLFLCEQSVATTSLLAAPILCLFFAPFWIRTQCILSNFF